MKSQNPNSIVRVRSSALGRIVLAILLLGLLGGMFHHHDSARERDTCARYHIGVQIPVIDLATSLANPMFTVAEFVNAPAPGPVSRRSLFGPLPARAPPATASPAIFPESHAAVARTR